MTTILQGEKLLQRTEAELRKLLSDAAVAGDYEAATVLTRWASQVAQLSSQHRDASVSTVSSDVAKQQDVVAHQSRNVHHVGKRLPSKAKPKRKNRCTAPSDYPKFLRRGEEIIKVGWSKRSRSEYQHKAPYKVVSLLAAAIAARVANGSLLVAHELMPLADPSDGTEVPDYQVYVCLAWLRQEGLVEQEGRQGYLVSNPASLEKRADDKWKSMLSR
jgi:hypothetical protein